MMGGFFSHDVPFFFFNVFREHVQRREVVVGRDFRKE